jgi:3-deoxy-D-manno-octulosonate 8-phosphate phosphatase (KDO 8-P phosphatase)
MVQKLEEKIKKIKILVLDVDGVLTDGQIIIDGNGIETKAFDVKDGHGIVMARQIGLRIAFLSGRSSPTVIKRAEELRVPDVFQGMIDKRKGFDNLMKKYGLKPEEIAYIGDDIIDIPVLKKVGFSIAVSDAVPEVRAVVHYVTKLPGGRGAVREVIDLILKVQGHWDKVMERYY